MTNNKRWLPRLWKKEGKFGPYLQSAPLTVEDLQVLHSMQVGETFVINQAKKKNDKSPDYTMQAKEAYVRGQEAQAPQQNQGYTQQPQRQQQAYNPKHSYQKPAPQKSYDEIPF